MNTAKIYVDTQNHECSIMQMVTREPAWAAKKIQEGEKAIEEVKKIRETFNSFQKFLVEVRDTVDVSKNRLGLLAQVLDKIPLEEAPKATFPTMVYDLLFSKNVLEEAAEHAIDVLNGALAMNAEAISKLLLFSIPCPPELVSHPTIQVRPVLKSEVSTEQYELSVLGLINGLFGLAEEGRGRITAQCATETSLIHSFIKTRAETQ